MRTRFCLFLVVALAASPLLADSLGGLTVSGKVWTNQVALPSGSSVYAGDRIQTGAAGMAVLGAGPQRVEIRPDSSVTLRADSLDLHRGAVGSSGSDVVCLPIHRGVSEADARAIARIAAAALLRVDAVSR